MAAHFEYDLGRDTQFYPCRWIQGSVNINPDKFELIAGLWARYCRGSFIFNRLQISFASRFTAEDFLALLEKIAAGPFAPTEGGLQLRVTERSKPASDQIARILEPGVRLAKDSFRLAPEMTECLENELSRLRRHRRFQLALAMRK